jgi:hypothetical protein
MPSQTPLSETDILTIRAAFNRWAGPVQRLDTEGKKQEVQEREATVDALTRLLAINHQGEAAGQVRPVTAPDVERVLACFRRLTLLGAVTPSAIAAYCEKIAEEDDNHFARRADPLSLRYVLTYHQEPTRAWFAARDLDRLRYVCERADLAGIRAWFAAATADKEALPKESGQYLRSWLLRFWNRRMGDLESLAFEQAVLEVRLFHAIGWENTRMFCALLRKIGGGDRTAFGAYLTREDIAEALLWHETLGQDGHCAHLRALADIHDAHLVVQLEQTVHATAVHADEAANPREEAQPAPPAAGPASPATPAKNSRLRRLFGIKTQTL